VVITLTFTGCTRVRQVTRGPTGGSACRTTASRRCGRCRAGYDPSAAMPVA